jgi:hypothetical protein
MGGDHWNGTQINYEQHGSEFEGRFLIGRDGPINKGVSVGIGMREAIVVDLDRNPDSRLNQKLTEIIGTIEEGSFTEADILNMVSKEVKDMITEISETAVLAYLESIPDYHPHKKVLLDNFFEVGVGVCRHLALGVGVILEQLVAKGILKGEVSIDRSFGNLSAHMWVRYTNSTNREVFIIDPAHNFIGSLETSQSRLDGNVVGAWDYRRPHEEYIHEQQLLERIVLSIEKSNKTISDYKELSKLRESLRERLKILMETSKDKEFTKNSIKDIYRTLFKNLLKNLILDRELERSDVANYLASIIEGLVDGHNDKVKAKGYYLNIANSAISEVIVVVNGTEKSNKAKQNEYIDALEQALDDLNNWID